MHVHLSLVSTLSDLLLLLIVLFGQFDYYTLGFYCIVSQFVSCIHVNCQSILKFAAKHCVGVPRQKYYFENMRSGFEGLTQGYTSFTLFHAL